ncbi:PepSY domain-containing protein [Pollutimonas nitritireducens]|nr:PepSY domain-containing protein [Pollutimonas nitritireducens]
MKMTPNCIRALPSRRRASLQLVLAAVMLVSLAGIPGTAHAHEHLDHDRARQALISGEVLSLRQVLDLVGREYPGEPVEIEFEHDDGLYVYEIKLLQPGGTIVKMKVDAATGTIIKIKGRGIERRSND